MSTMLEDLRALLAHADEFSLEWAYNPFDNYVWREVIAFEFIKKFYPTAEKLKGRYGYDGKCEELGMTKIEMKSLKTEKRKKKGYRIVEAKYEFDMSKNGDKTNGADGYVFAIFDKHTSGDPIDLLFVMEKSKIESLKKLIAEKQQEYRDFIALNPDKRKKREVILVAREDILPLAEVLT
jgi:hypothetical protein